MSLRLIYNLKERNWLVDEFTNCTVCVIFIYINIIYAIECVEMTIASTLGLNLG